LVRNLAKAESVNRSLGRSGTGTMQASGLTSEKLKTELEGSRHPAGDVLCKNCRDHVEGFTLEI